MQVTSRNIAESLEQLRLAHAHVRMAGTIDVPRTFGRGAAKDQVDSHMRSALEATETASAELEGAGSALRDVHRGISHLGSAIRMASLEGNPVRALGRPDGQQALEGAKAIEPFLEQVGTGLLRAERGEGVSWLLRAVNSHDDAQVKVGRTVGALLPEMAAARPYIEAVEADDIHSVARASMAIDGRMDDAGRALVRDIADGRLDRWEDAPSLVRALEAASRATGRTPSWLSRAADRGWPVTFEGTRREQLRFLAHPTLTATAVSDELWRLLDSRKRVTTSELVRIRAICELPAAWRPVAVSERTADYLGEAASYWGVDSRHVSKALDSMRTALYDERNPVKGALRRFFDG